MIDIPLKKTISTKKQEIATLVLYKRQLQSLVRDNCRLTREFKKNPKNTSVEVAFFKNNDHIASLLKELVRFNLVVNDDVRSVMDSKIPAIIKIH